MTRLLGLTVASLLAACTIAPSAPPKMLNDGELSVSDDYHGWPKFLSHVDRPDAKQVREIWINPVGARARAGQPFADGTVLVMELHAAKANPDGTLAKGPDGKLVKDKLAKVFVMGKNAGWGQAVPEGQRNGNWIYSAFLADGKTPSGDPIAPCRTCHLPLTSKDFVHRYDEYFAARPTMEPPAKRPISGY